MATTFWEDADQQKVITTLKEAYLKHLDFLQITDNDFSRFIWAGNKCITLYAFSLAKFGGSNKVLIIAKSSNENKIIFRDCQDETNNINFKDHQYDKSMIVSFLKSISPEDSAVFTGLSESQIMYSQSNEPHQISVFIDFVLNDWVEKEYHNTKQQLEQRGLVESFQFSKQRLYVDRFHFEDMLKTINDDQFTDEFNQCLFAYDNQKWFLCASGLGSCLEHLLSMIVQNYPKLIPKNFPKDPTFQDFRSLLKKPPISIDSRQTAYLNMLFIGRNSIDHFNSGYTSKNICDTLLDGVANIFNDYYLPSLSAS